MSPRIQAAISGWSRLRSWKRCPARLKVDQRRGDGVLGMVQTLLVEAQGKSENTSQLSVPSYTSSGLGARVRAQASDSGVRWRAVDTSISLRNNEGREEGPQGWRQRCTYDKQCNEGIHAWELHGANSSRNEQSCSASTA
jgi:hypothetical protein